MVGIISSNVSKPIIVEWKYLEQAKGDSIDVSRLHTLGRTITTSVVPDGSGKIGISLKQTLQTRKRKLSPIESVASGLNQTWKMSVMTLQGFAKIITGQEDFRKSVGGPVKIAKMANQSAEQGPVSFLYFLSMLSISLAIINIMPIPALDGGQFVLNAIEGIMRRELSLDVKIRIQQIGMALLLALFAYILINDILNP